MLIYWVVVASGQAFRLARQRTPEGPEHSPAPLVVRSTGRTRLVEPKEIDWIEAAGSYARLHVGSRSFLLRRSLSELSESLSEAGFARVHRSATVNLARIVEVRPRSHGEATVVLNTGRQIKVSRTFRQALSRLGL